MRDIYLLTLGACFTRVTSIVYGRPAALPPLRAHKDCPDLPTDMENDCARRNGGVPGAPTEIPFFRQSIQLYITMEEITREFFERTTRQNAGGSTTHRVGPLAVLSTLLDLDEIFLTWHSKLPDHLKFQLDQTETAPHYPLWLQRQRAILQHRFLILRIVFHRQSLMYLLHPDKEQDWLQSLSPRWPSSFGSPTLGAPSPAPLLRRLPGPSERHLALESAKICVSSALLLVESVQSHSAQRISGAWWWSLHCMHSSWRTEEEGLLTLFCSHF